VRAARPVRAGGLGKRASGNAGAAPQADPTDKHDPVGRNRGNSRNGVRSKTVLTEIGPVEIEVPRDIDATFSPTIVKKRQRRLTGLSDRVVVVGAGPDHWGDLGALRRGVWGERVAGDGLQDHRPGAGGDDGLDVSATG
jgi:hypothetical protein